MFNWGKFGVFHEKEGVRWEDYLLEETNALFRDKIPAIFGEIVASY